MKIKSFFADVRATIEATTRRKKCIEQASDQQVKVDPIRKTSLALHPGKIEVRVKEIRPASPTTKTFVFESASGHFPLFSAGQFMTLEMKIGDSLVTRPYSISSAPYQTRGENPLVEITVKKAPQGGFVSEYLINEVNVGDSFMAEVGLGQFYYEPLRDSKDIVCLAGGSSITPFLSMAKEVKHGTLDANLTILYGSVSQNEILLKDELEACICDHVKVIHVLSGDNPGWTGEKGFINADIIKKYAPDDCSFFVCGPQAMYDFIGKELQKLSVAPKRIRMDVYGQINHIESLEDFPKEKKDSIYKIKVIRGVFEQIIEGKAVESIAVSLERAGIKIHTACRSGICGFCRIKVLSGSYFVSPYCDGRRKSDRQSNYVHACATYPTSDLTIKIPI